MDASTARLDLLAVAVRAAARALPVSEAQAMVAEATEAVDTMLAETGPQLTLEADEALAVETRALLSALAR